MQNNIYRFFVSRKNGDFFELSKETLDHIKVLRLKPNENFYCIFEKEFYLCNLKQNKAFIIAKHNINNEFSALFAMGISVLPPKKMKLVIQKCVELGVTDIFVFTSKFSQSTSFDKGKFIDQWQKVVRDAAEQSFRNVIPRLHSLKTFAEMLEIDFDNKLIAHEKVASKQKIYFPLNSLYLIGPEGGFASEEIDQALLKKFQVFSLGSRILRSETAAIVVAANVNQDNI